ncbi:hypothetical protein HMI55_005307 [Coelomomyces lativittatus]|nr:hypothetical protein HMI55_005307 [Coelomomyces lativittatus]
MYTKSDVPYFEKKNCKAVQLYLKGQDGKRIEGMSVYLIDTFGKLLTMIAWDEAFVGLKKGGKTKNGFQMLKFNLDAEIKFDTNFFPKLLSAGNTEFKSVADTVEFKFRQKILSCVDQNGSRGQGIPSKSKENISLPENVDWFLFSDFYFIIADDMIGIPYLIHKIDKSLESKESC